MDMSGEERIAAPREAVWAALNDPEVLKACIPGCQSLTMKSPTELEATVKIKIGPVSASFSGEVTLSNLNPPESYTISGEGKGGIAGFAKGGADVRLTGVIPDPWTERIAPVNQSESGPPIPTVRPAIANAVGAPTTGTSNPNP